MKQYTANQYAEFKDFIWDFYKKHGRSFAWRQTHNAYHIVVSEIMLQQTQTHRVAPKYQQFITALPTFEALAKASLRDVLSLWQGLGYNRRGKYVHQIGQKVVSKYNGVLPQDPEILVTFSGIGKATAASICAFAFNKPTVFIETNIRAVYLHTFFRNQANIPDTQLMPLIASSVDQDRPREWYYALMDYGVYLKKTLPTPSRKSRHHTKQSTFEGSDRQIRGQIIRLLTNTPSIELHTLPDILKKPAPRVEKIVAGLLEEKMILKQGPNLRIAE